MRMSDYLHHRLLVLFLLLHSKLTSGVQKFWLPNLEWETANNWIGGIVPEVDSRVIFPLDIRHAVGVAKSANLRLSQIDLSRTGSLVLARDGKLELSGASIKRESTWKREGHLFWADPENWNGTSIAAPHLERVPCRQDDVILPETEHTLSILLPVKDIQVRSIKTSDQLHSFTKWQWEDFQDLREFTRGRFTVKYSPFNCERCPCQDDLHGDYLEEVCAIERPRCEFAGCEYPLTVEGHCCQYCGGRISLTDKSSLALVKTIAGEALEKYKNRFAWHVRRIHDGTVEVLVKEKSVYSGIDIEEAIDDAKETLRGSGIEVLRTETGGEALGNSRLAVVLGPFFGTPVIIFVLLLLGFSYFGYSFGQVLSGFHEAVSSVRDGMRTDKSQPRKPFGFARFENIPEGNVQIEGEQNASQPITGDAAAAEQTSSSGGRFENPLYRSKRKRENDPEIINMETPLSLTSLKDTEKDHIEEVEMNIDQ